MQFLAVSAAALSQVMQCRESGTAVALPSLRTEKRMLLDWDRPCAITTRACMKLDLIPLALERYGTAGQPMWPLVPSSFYGAFLPTKRAT
jgi:hypothetical protein